MNSQIRVERGRGVSCTVSATFVVGLALPTFSDLQLAAANEITRQVRRRVPYLHPLTIQRSIPFLKNVRA